MRKGISVCMASYNGEKYISEQIKSILKQLQLGDELIIVDDSSTDNSVEIIKSFKSDFIKLYENKLNIGYIKTFERALRLSKNKYVCLSDQDDIWMEGRLNSLYNSLIENNVMLVASNFEIVNLSNREVNFVRLETENSKKYFGNILRIFQGKSAYYGCTMMMKKSFLEIVLPFPTFIEAHDLWMAMNANIHKSIYHLSDDTLRYRVHQNNSSLRKRSIIKKIVARFYFCKSVFMIKKKKSLNLYNSIVNMKL